MKTVLITALAALLVCPHMVLSENARLSASLYQLKQLAAESHNSLIERADDVLSARNEIKVLLAADPDAASVLEQELQALTTDYDGRAPLALLAVLLLDTYAQGNRDAFLAYAENAIKDETYPELLKSHMLSLLSSTLRMDVSKSDDHEYDRYSDADILPVFMAATTISSPPAVRGKALRYLLGYSMPGIAAETIEIKPINKDAGIKALKELVYSDLPFERKQQYWEMLSAQTGDDSEYISALRAYIEDTGNILYYRYSYAKHLVERGALSAESFAELKTEWEKLNASATEIRVP